MILKFWINAAGPTGAEGQPDVGGGGGGFVRAAVI